MKSNLRDPGTPEIPPTTHKSRPPVAIAKKPKVMGIKQEITTATTSTAHPDESITAQFPLSPTTVLASITNESEYPLFTSDMLK
jgi:hypothetical protein